MAYEPTVWETGDVISAAKLNKLEQGVANSGGGFLVVNINVDQNTGNKVFDKTWQEIYDAMPFVLVYGVIDNSKTTFFVTDIGIESGTYYCQASLDLYECSSSSDYPSNSSGEPT